MKLSLVVASGVHAGKGIPITTPQFVVGRDPQCQLRPASPAISKRHCAILVRGPQVFVRDFGSTNGTFVNENLVEGEVELHDQDLLKVGPLEFRVAMEVTTLTTAPADSKPMAAKAQATAAVAAVEAKTAVAVPGVEKEETVDISQSTPPTDSGPPSDNFADFLLDDDKAAATGQTDPTTLGNESVPDGSTIMELPAVNKPGQPAKTKTVLGTGNTSEAAAEILKKYHRRPRN